MTVDLASRSLAAEILGLTAQHERREWQVQSKDEVVAFRARTKPVYDKWVGKVGADLAGFILARESPRRAERVLPVPETMLSVAVFVGQPEQTGADLVQLYDREEDKVRGRDALLLRGGEQGATVIDLPWEEDDPSHLERARATAGRLVLAGGLGPLHVRLVLRDHHRQPRTHHAARRSDRRTLAQQDRGSHRSRRASAQRSRKAGG